MTHDELLAKFDDLFPYDDKGHALRAVVELHKPQLDDCPCCTPLMCECAEKYPCATIQAIEKELG